MAIEQRILSLLAQRSLSGIRWDIEDLARIVVRVYGQSTGLRDLPLHSSLTSRASSLPWLAAELNLVAIRMPISANCPDRERQPHEAQSRAALRRR